MSTKTIDERLREKARKTLRDSLNKAVTEFIRAICASGTMHRVDVSTTKGRGEDTEKVEIFDTEAIRQIADAAFERLHQRSEEDEINRFMRQVDGFQDQLNRMYGDIYGEE